MVKDLTVNPHGEAEALRKENERLRTEIAELKEARAQAKRAMTMSATSYAAGFDAGVNAAVFEYEQVAGGDALVLAIDRMMAVKPSSECDAWNDLRTENERLRAALKPFADEAAYWFCHNYDREDRPVEGFSGYQPVMTCGDLFNARAALSQNGED